MKRKEILVLIGEVLGSRAVYSIASLVITITMLSGITIILRNDIRDIKNYVQSVVDGDPNYKEVHEQVSGSKNAIRGDIEVQAFLAKENNKTEGDNTSSNINSGYDNYTPIQTITDDTSNKPSNSVNNSTGGGITVADNNSNDSNSNNTINSGNVSNNNSNESKKEDVLDRSSFNGKDVIVSEGEPFNPMNALQLAATDINGKNITNKIVIKENNVDTYKPGLYTVKANVTLSNENTLEKEFLVRVEPTILNLAVNDLKISKDVLEKNEHFNLTFAIKSSKSYLEVTSVNINNKDYDVKKTSSSSFLRTSNKYEVDLVAPSKGGWEKIQIKSVTMSDGTIVDVDKSVEVEVLRQEAQITDVVVKNISNENENISLEYKLEDIDEVIEKAVLYLYNENNIIIQREELEKNNNSYVDLNITENGQYKIEIKGYYKENLDAISKLYKEKKLFTQNLEVNKFNCDNITPDENDALSNEEELMLMSAVDNEEYIKLNLIQSHDKEGTHEVKITGEISDDNGEFKPGTIQVVVPTIANFTITNKGKFIKSDMVIKNYGTSNIDVVVQKFIDVNGDKGINIQGENLITRNTLPRNNISLNITGEDGIAYLGSNKSTTGVFSDSDLEQEEVDGVIISTIRKGSTGVLKLNGEVSKGTEEINNAIQDKFTLILRIKRSEKN